MTVLDLKHHAEGQSPTQSNVGTAFHIVIYMLTETGWIDTVTKTVTKQFSRHTYNPAPTNTFRT